MVLLVTGQARNENWVYSKDVWLNFSSGALNWQSSNYQPSLRSASISDVLGNFLMLADDGGIHGPLFDLMSGGDSLALNWTQPSSNYLILPKPGAGEHYIVVRIELAGERRAGWVEVDMEANSGSGVVLGTTAWYASNVTAKMAATLNAAGDGYWIVQHEDGSDAFLAYALDSSGMAPFPVISHAGSAFASTTYPTMHTDFAGPMNFSVDGNKLALAQMEGTVPDTSQLALFHFDALVGTVEAWCTLNYKLWHWNGAPEYIYLDGQTTAGVEFDASGMHLYASAWDTLSPGIGNLYAQFTIPTDQDQMAIQESGTLVYGNGNGTGGAVNDPSGTQIHLAPNGRLYGRQVSTDANEFYPLIFELCNLPVPEIPTGPPAVQTNIFQILSGTHSDGFPTMSKRYHDSAPEWLGLSSGNPVKSVVQVRPCPMLDEAVLFMPMNDKADAVEWYSTAGVKLRVGSIQMNGPSFVMDRYGLPAGVYYLRILYHSRLVGQTKVVCR